MGIASQSDFKAMLERIWLTPHAMEATQDLRDGVLIEQYYENQYPVLAKKAGDGWSLADGPAPRGINVRMFYYADACDVLAQAPDFEGFARAMQQLVADKRLIFIPMMAPEMLVLAGFADFARRVGLPAK